MSNNYKYKPIVDTPLAETEQTAQVIEGNYFKSITLLTQKPTTAIMPKTKAQEQVFSGNTRKDIYNTKYIAPSEEDPNVYQIAWNVGNLITGKEDIVVPVRISSQQLILSEGTVIDIDKKLTPFDMSVHDAICSLVENEQKVMTTRQIAEAMTGQRCESKGVLSAVTRSINKMRTTTISLDYTEQIKAYGVEPNPGHHIIKDSNILHLNSLANVNIHGKVVAQAWEVLAEPGLFTYAKELGQVATCPMAVLQAPINKNERNTVLIRRLAKEIETMKNSKTHYERTMKFDTIFEKCAFIDISDKVYRSLRETVFKILDYWTDSEGYIKGYYSRSDKERIARKVKNKPLKKVQGKTITGVEIIL